MKISNAINKLKTNSFIFFILFVFLFIPFSYGNMVGISGDSVRYVNFYSPFGKTTSFGSVSSNPYTFTGRRLDSTTGLLYYRSRYMMPGSGRFMQADKWGSSAWAPWANHPFTYVNNNPFAFIDPYGLWSISNSLSWIMNWSKNVLKGASEDIINSAVFMRDNIGTVALTSMAVAAGSVWVPTATAGTIIGVAGIAVGESINEAIQLGMKGKDNSKVIGKALVRLASFYVAAKNAPAAIKKMGQSIRKVASNVKKLLRSVKNASEKGLKSPKKYFKGKTKAEIETIFEKKYGPPRGQGLNNKSYYNPKTKRTFNVHQDPLHRGGKPHIDVRRRGLKKTRVYELLEE